MDDTLSMKERLIIANQYDILARLSEDEYDKQQFENLRDIFTSGYSRYYSMATDHFSEEVSQKECKFVVDVLDLYRDLYYSRENTPQGKEMIKEKDVLFKGFDLNDPQEVKYLRFYEFLVKQLNRYDEIQEFMDEGKIDGFNSHGFGPSMHKLRAMIAKREEIISKKDLFNNDNLTVEEIEEIIKAY